MTKERQLRRSRSPLIGGVCAGIAEYLDVDPVVLRILWVAFTILSCGLLSFFYAALWVALPKAPLNPKPVVVEPKAVRSDTFGDVDCRRARGRCMESAHLSRLSCYAGSAHVPPAPPSRAVAAASGANTEGDRDAESASSSDLSAASVTHQPSALVISCVLFAGCLLLSAGAAFVLSSLVRGVLWWQCWPVLLLVIGIMRMAVPGAVGVRALAFSWGLCVCSLGAMLLPMSMGFLSWETLELGVRMFWPVLVVGFVLVAAGIRLNAPLLVLAAAAVFVLFCVTTVSLCGLPGPMSEFSFVTPFGREYHLLTPRFVG